VSLDITGPYFATPRKNKYLLTFIDHFTRYVEAFAILDVSAETCARVYATQNNARHGCGSTMFHRSREVIHFGIFPRNM